MRPRFPMKTETMRHQRGYTLAEVLVGIAVFAVVILAALAIYDRSNRVFRQGVESSNLQQNTRVAFNKLVSDMRMAGFDFDRDGVPTGANAAGTNQYQQPDEQFEYIGPAAVSIRGNFDFESEAAPCTATLTDNCDQGREKTFESSFFPVVTTGNDEIITYALVPDSQTSIPAVCDPLTNCVEFYADTNKPRKSYPDTGGLDEGLVQIRGVDLCMDGCNNPPYTLYRFTLKREETDFTDPDNITRTPLASNIRSMRFTYFQDAQGLEVLRDIDNLTDVSTGEEIRGLGQFRINSSAAVAQRLVRAKVNSILVELIGMNETADRDFVDPVETITAVENFRKYRLETLVSPRNIQKRGMREQAAYAPGPPTNVEVCTGACGGVYVSWDAPAETANRGAPDQYQILIDEAAASGWSCSVPVFSGTSAHVFLTSCGQLTPNVQYKFAVVAINDFGSATSAAPYDTATPLNATRAEPPELLSASNDKNGEVALSWRRPSDHATGSPSCGPESINPAEILGYIVERAPSGSGNWTPLVTGGGVTVSSPHEVVDWSDTTAVNCVPYDYRVSLMERCGLTGNEAYNSGDDIELGFSEPSNVEAGQATSTALPKTPTDLQVEQTLHNQTGNRADAHMSWQRVTADENEKHITVQEYNVYRRALGATEWGTPVRVTVDPAVEVVTHIDSNVPVIDPSTGSTLQYQYTVTALQCTDRESLQFQPFRLWPCTFPAGIIGTPPLSAPGAFNGDGSAVDPWLIVDDAAVTLNVVDPSLVQQVDARVYTAEGALKQTFGPVGAAGPFTFEWQVDQSAVEQIVVTIVDTTGCTKVVAGWVSDEAQACCLVPQSADGTVVDFVAGNDFVDIVLKNVCGEALEISGFGQVVLTWTAPGNPTRLSGVVFPTPAGGTVIAEPSSNNIASSSPITLTVPSGAAPVPAGSTTYRVRVQFNRAFAANPVLGFTVEYRRPGELSNDPSCPIVP